MAELESKFILTLDRREASALKKLLGNMNDSQFQEFGIAGADREIMTEIYNLIPYEEDE